MINTRVKAPLVLLFSVIQILVIQTFADAQATQFFNVTVQNGDLLFVEAKNEDLSGAINRVTQKEESMAFDHVGLVEVLHDRIYLIHATGEKGTIRETMQNYLQRSVSEKPVLFIFRLKGDYQKCVPDAIDEAKKWLGKPYNWSYVLNDSSIYCSDLVERAFRKCHLFDLEPMTFKDPKQNEFDAYWIQYYNKLGIPIPEGQLGCNPNGLATSNKLQLVGRLVYYL